MNTPDTRWEEEFDEKLGKKAPFELVKRSRSSFQDLNAEFAVKSFIRETLSQHDAELVERVEEEIEKWQPSYDDLSNAHIDGLKSAIKIIKGENLTK